MDKPYDGLAVPQRYWAILTVALGISMAVLDGAIANIALPTIAKDLNTSPASSIWVVNAYQLTITISLLAMSSLGDIYGYRKVYRAGLILFTITSALCAMSTSLPMLTISRILQGFGAAGIMSINGALTRIIYPKRLLGRGMGINALIVALSSAAGPTLASFILSFTSWQWLFAINIPIGLVATIIAFRALPANPYQNKHAFDWTSAALNAAMFGLMISGIDGLGHQSRLSIPLTCIVAAIVIGYIFVKRQQTLSAPLLPVDLLKIPIFSLSIGTSICSFAAQMLAMVSLPFYMQQVLGKTEVATGFLMTPWPVAIMCVAPWAGKLVEKYSPGILGAIGLAIFACGLYALAMLPPQPGNSDIIWRMAICGIGFGFFQSPNNFAIITSAPSHRSGGASGMLGTARLVGQTLGASLVALLFVWFDTKGTHASLLLAAFFAIAAAVISCLRLATSPAPAQVAANKR